MGWNRTGTVSIASGSTAVTGVNTNFNDTAQGANPGDGLIVGTGTNLRIYEVASVNSATSLTLATPADVAVSAATFQIMTSVQTTNSGLAKKVSAAMDRMLNSVANWFTMLNGSGVVEITNYDGTKVSGLAWPTMSDLANKSLQDTSATALSNLNQILKSGSFRVDLSATGAPVSGTYGELFNLQYNLQNVFQQYMTTGGSARRWIRNGYPNASNAIVWTPWAEIMSTNTVTPIANGGTGAANPFGSAANTFAQGNDSRLNTVAGKTGGEISSSVTLTSAGGQALVVSGLVPDSSGSPNRVNYIRTNGVGVNDHVYHGYYLLSGQYHCYRFVQNNTETLRIQNNGACIALSFYSTSDSRLKFNKKFLSNALSNSVTLRGMVYDLQGERKCGVIAQDAEKFMPEAVVTVSNEVILEDGTIIKDGKSLDYSAIAGLHTEALKDVVELMLECLTDPESATKKLKDIVKLINRDTSDKNETDMRMEWALVEQPKVVPEGIEEPPVEEETTEE